MISQSLIKEFREGEYIIKQGEVGEELFIILEGACDVVEDKNFAKSNSIEALDRDRDSEVTAPNLVKLVTLREGHFFGEMSLMTVSKRITVCVIMCVSVFVCVGVTVSEIVCEFYPLFHHVPYFFPHCPIRPSLPPSSALPFLSPSRIFLYPSSPLHVLIYSLFFLFFLQNNPRMASVIAIVPSICLSLSKTVFRNALSEESFAAVLSTVLNQRKKARKRRQAATKNRLVTG